MAPEERIPMKSAGCTGVLLKVAYEGTYFHGWAAQAHTRTVEQTLQDALHAVAPDATALRGTSRTDAGVHAEGQLVTFDTHRLLPARAWVALLNQHLPEDVSVRAACAVPAGFTARFKTISKRYRYRLLLDPIRDPLCRTRAWRIKWALDRARLAREATCLEGTHDFAAFRTSSDKRTSTFCTLTRVQIESQSDHRVGIVFEGDRFLHHMIRILVGTLVEVAL